MCVHICLDKKTDSTFESISLRPLSGQILARTSSLSNGRNRRPLSVPFISERNFKTCILVTFFTKHKNNRSPFRCGPPSNPEIRMRREILAGNTWKMVLQGTNHKLGTFMPRIAIETRVQWF